MAIGNLEVIGIGLQNESTGSDSLFTAFNKTKNNFAILANVASQYQTFTGNTGIQVTANAGAGTVDFLNTGVTSIIAGTGVIINQSNGNVTISSTGGGNGGGGGTVTSVGIVPASTNRLTVLNSPITSSGVITLDLATSGVTAGTYTYPTVTVDTFGRVTNISNATSVGTVTSIGVTTSGSGLQISGSPITSSGNISIINTGVTRLNAGTGINLSSSNGNVTISAVTLGGTVTSVGLSSSSLVVTNSPVITSGTISVELPANVAVTANITAGGGITTSNSTAGMGYSTGAGGTVTQGTSRTTGVTINKLSGAITLFSAAGTSSYTSFTVTNSTVAATDVIIVNQKSGTDKYEAWISNVAAGSFQITFADMSGTTVEQPVFNFAVIKAVAA